MAPQPQEQEQEQEEEEEAALLAEKQEQPGQDHQESSMEMADETKQGRKRGRWLHWMVDQIQRIRLPRSNRLLIEGLDRVVFGTVSAAEAVSICGGIRPPQYLWYMLSGAICDIVQFVLDCALHFGFGIEDATTCWTLSYTICITCRHTTHRYLVFGNYVGGYCNSLLRMYGGYSVIIVLSALFNYLMSNVARISHYVAYLLTLIWTGVVSFFLLKKLWSFGGKPSKGGAAVTPDGLPSSSTDQDTPGV
mmetsp:Transcript_7865/g.18186  ORF Transcript_7865/g.18186 Transcript_7865/m.18186 type:complete len:249 (+) Transcript_7865:204-950(+)